MSNLACRFITGGTNERYAKFSQWGLKKGSRDLLLIFWDSISQKWFGLETSNLACRFITRGTDERNAKLGQRGSGINLFFTG